MVAKATTLEHTEDAGGLQVGQGSGYWGPEMAA